MKKAFTLVEVLIAAVLLSTLALLVSDVLVTETQQATSLVDDLTINQQSRYFFQLLSRDVRSATQILVKPEQVIAETDGSGLALVQDPVDLSRCRLTLLSGLPAGTTRKQRVDYWLIGESGPPAGMVVKSAAVRDARVQTYNQAGTTKRLYPLVRTRSIVDETGTAHLEDDLLVGMVRGLAFYQVAPPATTPGPRPVLATVRATLILSAFKPVAGKGHVEVYRQRFQTGFTARSVVSAVFDGNVPDQGEPDPGE